MSSLQRYKKTGGFESLLSLIETFGPQKKEKFLEMIEAESAVWGRALREKMLSIERILGWPDEVMIEVFKELHPKNLAYVTLALKDDQKARIKKYFSASELRRLSDVLSESSPKPEEVASTLVKVVEQARKMIHERFLQVDKFDPKLAIPEDFEARLEEQSIGFPPSHAAALEGDQTGAGHSSPDVSRAPTIEVAQLQRSLAHALNENKKLKEEVRALRDKLEQIRKIA